MSEPLYETKTATVLADGTATVQLQPLRAFENWFISRMTISSTSTALVPTLKVYRGSVNPSQLIDGTYTGTLNQSDTAIDLPNGQAIIAQWTGATPGTTCTFTVQGRKGKL